MTLAMNDNEETGKLVENIYKVGNSEQMLHSFFLFESWAVSFF